MKTLIYIFIVVLASATSPTSCQEEEEPVSIEVSVNDEWQDSIVTEL